MLVKPRFAEEIVAVKLERDLIAEEGTYLVLSGGNQVEVLEKEDFERLFIVPTEEARRPAIALHMPSISPPKTRNRLSAEQSILLTFGPSTGGAYLKDLTISGMTRILPKIPAYRVLDKVSKLIRSKKVTSKMEKDQLVYNITEAGKVESKALRSRK